LSSPLDNPPRPGVYCVCSPATSRRTNMAEATQRKRSADGGAYGRIPQHPDYELTQVGAGTPCGELMRRYWQPVAVSADVVDRPQYVRILGEDLILFRDKKGRPGLVYP